jgi:hypothetical protein
MFLKPVVKKTGIRTHSIVLSKRLAKYLSKQSFQQLFPKIDKTTSKSKDFTSKSKDFNPKSKDFTSKSKDFNSESKDFNPKSKDFTSKSKDFNPKSLDFNSLFLGNRVVWYQATSFYIARRHYESKNGLVSGSPGRNSGDGKGVAGHYRRHAPALGNLGERFSGPFCQ